jgi:uncharacterized protein (TIGR03905 family)
MINITHKNSGTCSTSTTLSIDDEGIIRDVRIVGGCDGNIKGICKLVVGRKATEVADALRGTRCGFKPTSCPDQLACAIDEALRG